MDSTATHATFNTQRIGFIGFGNMASAMAQGWLNAGSVPAANLCACAGHFNKLQERCADMGITALADAAVVVEAADLIVVAVKPQMITPVLQPVAEKLAGKTLLSVAWGWDSAKWEEAFPGTHHISTVPNTPVSVNEGVIAVEAEHTLSAEEHKLVMGLLKLLGLAVELPSSTLFVGGTVGGCAPAFIAMGIEALADAAVKHGIPRAKAYPIVSQMILGTAALQLKSGAHPAAMKDAVCSPGGATIKGTCTLEEAGFRNALIKAIDATLK